MRGRPPHLLVSRIFHESAAGTPALPAGVLAMTAQSPAWPAGIRLMAMALCLAVAVPAAAATPNKPMASAAGIHQAGGSQTQSVAVKKKAVSVKKRKATRVKARQAVPAQDQAAMPSAAALGVPAAALAVAPTPVHALVVPAAALVQASASSSRPEAAATRPTALQANPYLAGWFQPTDASALPAMAVVQVNSNVRYVADTVTSLPGKLAEALPSIKTVHPTGGRDLVVANIKCPAEMLTGQYFAPTNALREGVNGLFAKLNDTQVLKFDIQLVCS